MKKLIIEKKCDCADCNCDDSCKCEGCDCANGVCNCSCGCSK